MNAKVKTIAAMAVVACGAAGCASTKGMQADVASLKNQVAALQTDVDSLKQSTNTASQTASNAQQLAQSADAKADRALNAAQSANTKAENNHETMDRMFAKSVSK